MNPVLYVILNGGLKMSSGKAAAQAVHAAMMLPEEYKHEFSDEDRPYKRTVIVLEAKNREQMDGIADYLVGAGVHFEMYTDEGKNEVDAFSLTAMAVETMDENDTTAREIFSALPLYGDMQKAREFADAIRAVNTCSSEPEDSRVSRLEAENRELRRLWVENEGDIIELRCMFNRYLRLDKRDRLRIGPEDPRLKTDRKEHE